MSKQSPRIGRRRDVDDPTDRIIAYLPVTLRRKLDDEVAARSATRNSLIVGAVREWLERNEYGGRQPDDAFSRSDTDARS